MARTESPHLLGLVGPPAEGDRGQAQHRGPAFGALDEPGDGRGVELHRRLSEQLASLELGETEIFGPHLEQLAPRSEPGQRQRRVGARCDRQPRPGREPLDERRDEPMDRPFVDHVVVVEHEHHLACRPVRERGGHRVEDAGERELRVERLGRVALGDLLDPAREEARSGREVADEADHVVVARVERDPRAADVRLARPGGQQGGLAEPGRRSDEQEPSLGRALQQGAQPRPLDQPSAPRPDPDLVREEEVGPWHRHRHRRGVASEVWQGASRRRAGFDASSMGLPRLASGIESTGGSIRRWMCRPGVDPQAGRQVPARSDRTRQRFEMEGAARYQVRIRVQGELAPTWSPVLADLAVAPEPGGTTLLSGRLADQAAVHGLLAAVRDLGLSLISVEAHAIPSSASRSGDS